MPYRRRKRIPGWIKATLTITIILLVILVGGMYLIEKVPMINKLAKFWPSRDMTDLEAYYNLDADSSLERAAASEDEMAIVLEDDILSKTRALKYDNAVYVPYTMIANNIDERFYIDENEKLLVITNAEQMVTAEQDVKAYTVNGTEKKSDYAPMIRKNAKYYVALDFLTQYSVAVYEVYDNPERVYIKYLSGEYEYCTTVKDTAIRVRGGIKSDIVATVAEGAKLKILDDLDDWLEVIDDTGYRGYVQTSAVSDRKTEKTDSGSKYNEPEYTHISLGSTVNMTWQSVGDGFTLNDFNEMTADITGVNILSPTWYSFSGTEGSIVSVANAEYIAAAKEKGWQVWAMLHDPEGDCMEIIPYTSKRQTAIKQIIEDALANGIDGINVDIEGISSDYGDDYIQFIRELSIECRANGLILSVDNYAPYSYNACYHITEQSKICDYVIVMAYDDYVGEDQAGPNSGLPFLEKVIELCEDQVEMGRTIIALPFYTRVWIEEADGNLRAETFGMHEANGLVKSREAELTWNSETGYNYATYTKDDGSVVKVWLEDASSIDAKLKYLVTTDIAGVATWKMGQETDDIWEVINKYY